MPTTTTDYRIKRGQFELYFDNTSREIARDHHAQGVKQQKDDYKLLQAYLNGES